MSVVCSTTSTDNLCIGSISTYGSIASRLHRRRECISQRLGNKYIRRRAELRRLTPPANRPDPYIAALLIALAQEQKFKRCVGRLGYRIVQKQRCARYWLLRGIRPKGRTLPEGVPTSENNDTIEEVLSVSPIHPHIVPHLFLAELPLSPFVAFACSHVSPPYL